MLLRRVLALVVFLIGAPSAWAQSPSEWAQRVDYEMDIRLDTETHRVDGHQVLRYTNNSPDTLRTVYYHLYFNAFQPESMFAERHRQLPDPDGRTVPRIFHLDPDEQGWHKIESLTQDGEPVSYEVTETVMRVELDTPIPPGATSTFEMDYRSQVPLQTRRSGRNSRGDSVDYTMTQWYPKMAEYDERGWHANFYVNREYYAPYGSFDVEITLPASYTVGATGVLQNPEAVGHGYDMDGNGTWRPSGPVADGDSLTWHFTAQNVHNFAWSADPDYVHDKVEEDGTTHHILYKPEVADQWSRLRNVMPELTRFFSDEYGAYKYPQMTVAQGGDGGMEYPMFTVVSSYNRPEFEERSSFRSVLGTTVHEFAHMWYYAMLGSNEADYAWMDEGFTSYATTEGMAHLSGQENPSHTAAAQSEAQIQRMGLAEPRSTPADWFQTNTAYGVASYPGGEMVVDMLGYVIGEEQRDDWLKRYYRARTFQHPDPLDLELFAEQESGLMLDWYFWQFTRSTRTVDDAIDDLEQTATPKGYRASFSLERKGDAILPHDVKLTLEDGSTQWVHVPLASTHGHKPVPADWIVADPWRWVVPEKTITVNVPSPVESATVDPEGRTPDVNRLNNTTSLPLTTRFLRAPQSDWFNYELGVRPQALYAKDFGFGIGVQTRGQYFQGSRRFRGTLTLWPEVLFADSDDPSLGFVGNNETGTLADGIDYELSYEHPFHLVGPQSNVEVASVKQLGVLENRLSLHAPLQAPLSEGEDLLQFSFLHQLNLNDRVFGLTRVTPSQNVNQAPFLVNPWNQAHAVSARADYSHNRGGHAIEAFAELGGSLRGGRALDEASRISVLGYKSSDLGPIVGTANARFGLGADGLFGHKQFQLGGRSLENQWRDDAYRQLTSGFERPIQGAHLVGFGPSGPVAYLRSERAGAERGFSGENVLSARVSFRGAPFPNVPGLSPLELSVFSGGGTVWNDGTFLAGFETDDLVGDAGFGARYHVSRIPGIERWSAQSDVLEDLKLVAKFPVWASNPELIQRGQDDWSFRWLFGVEL